MSNADRYTMTVDADAEDGGAFGSEWSITRTA